ncbi:MAG: cytochrome c3 family protein, partial [Gammaproteobacteria bacterium]
MHKLYAADIETLFMPGELIQGHAKFESECSKCHVRFQKSTQSQLCRDCHDDVDADMQAKTGYHGRNPAIADTTCVACHTDHNGRDTDIVLLNRSSFDHALTDFRLEQRHTAVSCAACHLPERKFSEAPSDCHDCHGEQDPHAGNLGEQCGDCHTAKAWKDTGFDHKKTDFPLLGKHQEVSCTACHLDTQYENTPQDCNSCHYLNDSHNGRNGDQCQDCHNSKRWDQTDFDHQKQTEFALRGKHRDISCESCHSVA